MSYDQRQSVMLTNQQVSLLQTLCAEAAKVAEEILKEHEGKPAESPDAKARSRELERTVELRNQLVALRTELDSVLLWWSAGR